MKMAMDVAEMFGEDVRHLHGNLYRVRRSLIRMARAGLSVEDGCLVYGNPRWFVNKDGQMEARGIDSSKMDELKSSIQNSGLDNPIRLRPIGEEGGYLEVVNGERRFRCIESLCEDEVICYDSAVGEEAPASDVYEWIDCRIEHMDDTTAIGIALKTNETSEVIGDQASIQVVKTLREAGFDDQEILKATGKSISWLRETDRIIGLDEVCLDHFENDQITRKAALHLSMIDDAEERLSVLEQIVSIARSRHDEKVRSLSKKKEDAETKQLINDSAAKVAMNIGDEEQANRLAEEGKKAKKKAQKASEDLNKISSKSPKADARDINRVRPKGSKKVQKSESESSAEDGCAEIAKSYIEMIDQIIMSEGFDEDGNSLLLNLEMLTAVSGVLNAIMEGEGNIMEILSIHCQLPLEMESESEEENTAVVEDDEEQDSADDDYDDDDEEEDEDEDEDEDSIDDSADEDEIDETPPELESEFREAADNDFDDEEEDD